MAEWIADASFIIHGAKIRARNEDEVDDVVYEIAESELFDDYVPLDAESTNASMTGARIVPGSENSRGVPLMTGDVRISLHGMVVYADSEAEAEDEVRDAMNDWAPAKFPFDGGREELVITGLHSYDDDDDYDDDEDDDSWSLRSRISGKRSVKAGSASKSTGSKGRRVGKAPAKPRTSEPRQRDSKGRFVSNSCRSRAKPKTTKPKTKGARR